MLAALTLTIGVWIIPVVITVAMVAAAWSDTRQAACRGARAFTWLLASVPALFAWLGYAIGCLLLR